jgi:hypothetical protein
MILSGAGLIEAGRLTADSVDNSGTLTTNAVQVAATLANEGSIDAVSLSAGSIINRGEIYVSEQLVTDKLTIDHQLSTDGEVQILADSIAALTSGGNVVIDLTSQALSPIQEGDYALLKVGDGSVTLDGNVVESGITLSNAVIDYFRQKNQKISLIGSAGQTSTFAVRDTAASMLTISLIVRELTEADKYWNTSSLTDGLGMVLGVRADDGSIVLSSNSVLDEVNRVHVDTRQRLT